MHNGGVESGLHAFVEEDGVEHLAGRRIETRRGRWRAREWWRRPATRSYDGPDALKGLDPVVAALFHAGGEGRASGSKSGSSGASPPLDGDVPNIAGGSQLPLRGAGLALLIDAGADHGGAELTSNRKNVSSRVPGSSPSSRLTELRTGATTNPFQGGSGDWALGRVDHERDAGLGGEPAGNFGHVGHAVGAGVVDAHRSRRAFLDLIAGHGHTGVPIGLEHVAPGSAWSRWRWCARPARNEVSWRNGTEL